MCFVPKSLQENEYLRKMFSGSVRTYWLHKCRPDSEAQDLPPHSLHVAAADTDNDLSDSDSSDTEADDDYKFRTKGGLVDHSVTCTSAKIWSCVMALWDSFNIISRSCPSSMRTRSNSFSVHGLLQCAHAQNYSQHGHPQSAHAQKHSPAQKYSLRKPIVKAQPIWLKFRSYYYARYTDGRL
jgi:hypothetical protein